MSPPPQPPRRPRPAAAALTSRRPGEGRRRHVATVVTASATSQNAASPSHVRSARAPCRSAEQGPGPERDVARSRRPGRAPRPPDGSTTTRPTASRRAAG
jgi:hypothetical protein